MGLGERLDSIRCEASGRGVTVVVDLSERRESERRLAHLMAELESKERLLHAVLQQMPTGLLIAEAPSGRKDVRLVLASLPRQRFGVGLSLSLGGSSHAMSSATSRIRSWFSGVSIRDLSSSVSRKICCCSSRSRLS